MTIFNCITQKFVASEESELKTIESVINKLGSIIAGGFEGRIFYSSSIDLQELKAAIKAFLNPLQDEVIISEGASQGCYGSSTGYTDIGLTVYLDARMFQERQLDGEGDEIFNFAAWLDSYGELVEDLDGEAFEESCEQLGLKLNSNNSYNYAGNGSDTPSFLFDIDYTIIEGKGDTIFLSVKFHCGGDPRGNYTEKVVFKMDLEESYSGLYPYLELQGNMSNCEVIKAFKENVLPSVVDQYGENDKPAINEAFNNYTDNLCKDGEITKEQYNMITLED